MQPWLDPGVWHVVAHELRDHRRRGLGGLLTEDTVRFAVARALVVAGADAGEVRAEWPHPALPGSRVDLVVGGEPPAAIVEVKYPRERDERNEAWTMALGEILKDFYRLALCPGIADRLFVYVEVGRLRRYMARIARSYGIDFDADTMVLRPSDSAKLPTTATGIIGADLAAHHVTASRIVLIEVDDNLRLAVYRVNPLAGTPDPAARDLAADDGRLVAGGGAEQASGDGNGLPVHSVGVSAVPALGSVPAGTRDGARPEILDAVRAVTVRSGAETFTVAQIVGEMTRRGTGYAESTIRTMITGHMCANAPDNAATTYDDLERVDRGVYRRVSPPTA